MGIVEELAARKAEFVSLKEVLETLAAQENCSVHTAAQWLLMHFSRESAIDAPPWVSFEPSIGMEKCRRHVTRPGLLLSMLARNQKIEIDLDADIPF